MIMTAKSFQKIIWKITAILAQAAACSLLLIDFGV
jgi:hypothetical protein